MSNTPLYYEMNSVASECVCASWVKQCLLTGAPGFPGTESGGMLGLPPGGGGTAVGVGVGLGAAAAVMAGVDLGAGEVFKRFSASLQKWEKYIKTKRGH